MVVASYKKDKFNIFLGYNMARILIIYPIVLLLFLYIFDDISYAYSNFISAVLDYITNTQLISDQIGEELLIFAGLTQYSLQIDNIIYPLLIFQKLQFVLVIFSIVIGLHIKLKKRLRYLSIIPLYLSFIIIQDISVPLILTSIEFDVEPLLISSTTLITSSYAASIILLYLILTTANLPKQVNIKPKLKQDSKNYYAFYFSVAVALLIIYLTSEYLLIPILDGLEFNVSVAILSLSILHIFRLSILSLGFLFANIKDIKRSYEYTPLVSVLIPAYNAGTRLEEAVMSIDKAASNYKGKVELIIIDDMSTDDTNSIANNLVKACKHVNGRVILGEGNGKSAALNLALTKEAKGELILTMDADTRMDRDAIKELVPFFADDSVGGAGAYVQQKSEEGILRKLFSIELMFIFGLVKSGQYAFDSVMVIAGIMSMYRRNVLLELGGWGLIGNGEDGDLTLRVGRYGYKIMHYMHKPLAFSEISPDFTSWFIQRTRWLRSFFLTHARNRTAVSMKQGIRGQMLMPFLYARVYNNFTSLLHIEMILLTVMLYFVLNDTFNFTLFSGILVVFLVYFVILLGLSIYYKRPTILIYYTFYLVYRYIHMLSAFRAFITVIGDEEWDTRATVKRRKNMIQELNKTNG